MSASLVNLETKTGTVTCAWTADPTSLSFVSDGESHFSDIATTFGCNWTAVNRNSDAWLSFSPSSGSQTTQINITASENAGVARTGYIDIKNISGIVVATVTCSQESGAVPSECPVGLSTTYSCSGGPMIEIISYIVDDYSIRPWDGIFTYQSPCLWRGYWSGVTLAQSWLGKSSGDIYMYLGADGWFIQITCYCNFFTVYATILFKKAYGKTPMGVYTAVGSSNPATLTVS